MCRSNQAAACHLHVVEVPSLASLSGHHALSWVCVSTFCHCCGRLELPSAAVEMEPGLKTPLVSSLWEVRAQSGVLSPKRAGEVQSSQVQPCFWSPVSLEMLLADLQDGSSGLCTYARHAAVPPGNTWSSSSLYFQIHLKKKKTRTALKGDAAVVESLLISPWLPAEPGQGDGAAGGQDEPEGALKLPGWDRGKLVKKAQPRRGSPRS